MATPLDGDHRVRFLPLRYDSKESEASALRLIHELRPEWQTAGSKVEFVRFTDGITNTLLKAVHKTPGLSTDDIDREALLLRAYGHGTDLIIDRQREAQNHELLMRYGLAPELLARFENGMLYRFIRGTVTRPEDMRRPEISIAIARRLAQWHAIVPCLPQVAPGSTWPAQAPTTSIEKMDTADRITRDAAIAPTNGGLRPGGDVKGRGELVNEAAVHKLTPNLWTVLQRWIHALPTETETQIQRRDVLQKELDHLIDTMSQRPGLGAQGLVFSHNDLLSGNVIVLPAKTDGGDGRPEVTFIDYEYAVPSPAAFDIANHFAEWGGFDCDMSVIPTISQRRFFIDEYIRTYLGLQPTPSSEMGKGFTGSQANSAHVAIEATKLFREVDAFRGLPGFYWGIWALIQATISQIDFDYASYAETRLSEYWAWKAEVAGSRAASGAVMSLREQRWAQDTDGGGHL